MYYNVIKHSGHLRTLEKRRKHSPAAHVFYISFLFSNTRRVLSQCNKRLRLLYLLNNRLKKPAARVFYISFVFSNARRVLSQCNKRLRLPYLLNNRLICRALIGLFLSSIRVQTENKARFITVLRELFFTYIDKPSRNLTKTM